MGSLSDPIADLLTRLRNASKAKHCYIDLDHSKMKEAIVKILKHYGFVAQHLVKEEKGMITMRVFLKYTADREPIIHGLKRVSKPSLRRYTSFGQIPRVLGGMGISVISTSKGVMSGEQARKQKIGGELLCLAW
ncbi:MAG: 30S ribosomal protein S8 [Chlamydiales bacterium]|nr:30S ribosomal protein S8 [Chlamydiales bacterium]